MIYYYLQLSAQNEIENRLQRLQYRIQSNNSSRILINTHRTNIREYSPGCRDYLDASTYTLYTH